MSRPEQSRSPESLPGNTVPGSFLDVPSVGARGVGDTTPLERGGTSFHSKKIYPWCEQIEKLRGNPLYVMHQTGTDGEVRVEEGETGSKLRRLVGTGGTSHSTPRGSSGGESRRRDEKDRP